MNSSSKERPRVVLAGCALFATSLVAGALHVALTALGAGPTASPDLKWSALFLAFITLDGVLLSLTFGGHNWARIACTAAVLLTFPFYGEAYQFLREHSFHPLTLFGFLSSLLAPVGVLFLFLPAANEWFSRAHLTRAAV